MGKAWRIYLLVLLFLMSFASAKCGAFSESRPIAATSSSVEGEQYSALKAIDGTAVTHWKANLSAALPQWIMFDLGETRCVNYTELYVRKSFGNVTADIQLSSDGFEWASALSGVLIVGGAYQPQYFVLAPARYIRIYETNASEGYGSLSEIRIMSAKIEGVTIFTLPWRINGQPFPAASPVPAGPITYGSDRQQRVSAVVSDDKPILKLKRSAKHQMLSKA